MQTLIDKVQKLIKKQNQIKNKVPSVISFDGWDTSFDLADVIDGFKSIDLDLMNASDHTVDCKNEVITALESFLNSINKDNEAIIKNNKFLIEENNKEEKLLLTEVAKTGILDYFYKVRLPINLYYEDLVAATKMPFDVNEERVFVFFKDKDSAEQLRSIIIDKFNEANRNSTLVKNVKGLINVSDINLSFLSDFLKMAKISNPQW